MKNIQLKKPELRQCFTYVLLLGVFTLMIPDMLKGIDLTDMAYMLARYKYVFDQEVPVNNAAIIVTDILGGILYHAVPEGQVLFLSLACWGLNCGMSLLSFRLLREYLNEILLVVILLGGGFFSITFIHVVHYDTFSMFFQILSFFLLIKGMDEKRKRWIATSGFFLGVNIFVRLPNILQVFLGLLIFWYFGNYINYKKKILNYIKDYVKGICSGVLLGILLSCIVLKRTGIKNLLFNTMESLRDSSGSYGAVSIIRRFFEGIGDGIRNTVKYEISIIFLVIALLGLLNIFFRKRRVFSAETGLKCYRIVEAISMIFILVYIIILTRKLSYISILEILVTNIIVIDISAAIYLRNKDIRLSTICMGCVIMELILTIGTNNGTSFYVVFMGFPMAATICAFWKSLDYTYGVMRSSCKYIMTIVLVGLLSIEGYQYYNTYVYRDSPKGLLDCEVNIKEYKGIKTSVERAGYLEDLVRILEPYNNYEMIALGDFSIGYVITDLVPFFTSAWPDLTSFGIESFQKQMERKLEQEIYPVILLADVYQTGEYRATQKAEMVLEVITKSEKYKIVHEDEYYRIYVPIEAKKDN